MYPVGSTTRTIRRQLRYHDVHKMGGGVTYDR
jgi:hypothetical protein